MCHPIVIAPCGRSATKLAELKNRLSSEVDEAASTIPTIITDSMDDEAIDRMVSQAKVRCTPTYTSVLLYLVLLKRSTTLRPLGLTRWLVT